MKSFVRSGSYLRALPILLLVFSLALPAVAQEQTGSVEGTVVDGTNAPVPGVTVTVRSEGDGFVRTVVTNTRGVFRVPAVPPGRYEISAELDGFQRAVVADAQISLGERLNLNFTIQPEAVEDVIEVTAEAPIISVTQSDTSAVISQEWVENLPVGRDFTSVVTQVPSANDEQDALGGISIDGASGAENRFIVDGMDTTNLQDGTSEKTLVTNFLEEVQVKASGYNAEFGGSTGGVISAVTKSGTNQWKGEVHGYYEESGLLLDERSYTGFTDLDNRNRTLQLNPTTGLAEYVDLPEDDFSRFEPGFTLGGPIYSDKVWFFAGYSPTSWEEERTITFLNDDVTNTFTRDNDYDYATANVTANLGPVYLKASFNLSDRERDNTFPNRNGTGSSAVEDYDVDEEKPNESWSLNADWLVNSNVAINARAGHFEYDTQETGFFTGIWHGFPTFSAGTPGSRFPNFPSELDRPLGNISPNNLGTLFDFFERDVITADVTFFADGFLGEHEIKVGGLVEDIGNSVVDGYTNTRILFYWDIPVTTPTGPRRGEYGYYRVLQIATQGDVSAENSAFFIQDSWRPTSRLTLNIGIRAEEENIPSFAADPSIPETAIAFDFDDKIAPRLGFAYDIKGDGRWKLYGSYGIFYDNTKLEMPRGSCGGDKWVDWFFALDTFDWPSIVDTCQIQDNSITAGPPPGCPFELFFAADRRFPSNDPDNSTIEPNLKPLESNEITIGVEHMLTSKIALGARYVRKELERTIEDVGVFDASIGAEVFFIANPGEGIAEFPEGTAFPRQPRAVRDYDALTLTLRKNFSNNWAANASYTYSQLEGNYSGLASSDEDGRTSPNVNRFFDSLQGSFDASGSGQPVLGELGTDRPHQFKAQFFYQAPWGTIVGLDQRIASGTPVTTEMSVLPGAPFFPYGRGDLGRTPTITQTDLYLAHEFPLGNNAVELSLSVFNLFDEDTDTDIFNERLQQDLPLTLEEFFAGFDPEQVIADNNVEQDTRFGLAEEFQKARSVRLGVTFRFGQ